MDEISQLDELVESDILDALGKESSSESEVSIENVESSTQVTESKPETIISSSNIDEISSLLKQLLNNKTIEITIKIKD